MNSPTMLCVVGFICRRVVAHIHLGLPYATFGTMRRPRVRSKRCPWDFDPTEPATEEGNGFAIRAALSFILLLLYGILATAEQPNGSVVCRLDIFTRLLARGFYLLRFSSCSYGAPFRKASKWLVNNRELSPLEGTCTCPLKGRRRRLKSAFNAESLKTFMKLCRPDCVRVFGREPSVGEPLCKFSGASPLPAMERLLQLQLPAMQHIVGDVPSTSCKSLEPPRWMGDLGNCLHWKTLIQ